MKPITDKGVQQKIASYPDHIRPKIERLRELIFDVAAHLQGVGPLEETLKWGEPSYLTTESKTGTTIRIDWKPKSPEQYAMYVNCQTSLVDTYRSLFPELQYEGNRAIIFDVADEFPEEQVRACIEMALNYHQNKSKK